MQPKNVYQFVGIILLLWGSICLFSSTGQAASPIKLYINNKPVAEKVVLAKQSIMVPIRVVSKQLGYQVNWNQKNKKVTVFKPQKKLEFTMNQKLVKINHQQKTVLAPPINHEQTTFVPLRVVGENMDVKVDWNHQTKEAFISDKEKKAATNEIINSSEPQKSEGAEQQIATEKHAEAQVTDFSFVDQQLHITLNQTVTPNIITMTNPDRVVIDLPNTIFSQQFDTQYSSLNKGQREYVPTNHPDVQRIRYAKFSEQPNTVRFVIDGVHALTAELTKNEQGMVTISVQPNHADTTTTGTLSEKSTRPDGKYVIVVDAGHGGKDSGSISITGKKEKDFTLSLALKVGQLLQQEEKFQVVFTREDDSYPTLAERSSQVNDLKADVFISIHGNSINKPSINGTETYYYHEHSKSLANLLHQHVVTATQFHDRNVRKNDFHVIRETSMPAVLLEIGYLSNENDEAQLYNEPFQLHVAQSIVQGIKQYVAV